MLASIVNAQTQLLLILFKDHEDRGQGAGLAESEWEAIRIRQ